MHRCFPQSVASTGWIRSSRFTFSSKSRPKALDISSLEFYPLLRSSIYPPVAVHVSHNGCHRSKTKPSTDNKLCICQQTDQLSLLTTIFCRCQQTVQLPPVPKPIQLKQTTSPKTAKQFFKGNYITTMYFVLGIVCCVVYCWLCITVLCCANNQMQFFSTKLLFFS